MTTLSAFFEKYKINKDLQKHRIILCDWRDQTGAEFNSLEEFSDFATKVKDEYYILNQQTTDDIVLLDYFRLTKTTPSVVALKHPLLTNGYWKDLPDKIHDIIVSDGGIYRYGTVDYGKNLKEYIIEFPSTVDSNVLEYCKELMPKFFRTKPSENQNVTLLFTNTNRFVNLDKNNFVIYKLESLYPEWEAKVNTLNLSRKVWNGIKSVLETNENGLIEE